MKTIIVGKTWKKIWNDYEELEPEKWYHRFLPIKRKMIKFKLTAFLRADEQVKVKINKNEITSDKPFYVECLTILRDE